MMSYHWNPFNFTAEPVRVTVGMHQLFSVPLFLVLPGERVSCAAQRCSENRCWRRHSVYCSGYRGRLTGLVCRSLSRRGL